ncbi:fibronectin type 3 and ankyrin repeat domains 1 protein [Euwallacea similis]|uniref:fibronectin type 3 and ankyrin repeat domains 1 protein n=1 Tax=Euwallacea similis TaxID=1736056 RepID=UPI00344F8693
MGDSDSGRESPVVNYRAKAAYRHPKLIDNDRNTELHYAAAANDVERMAKYLKTESNFIDPRNYLGWSPLLMAARRGHLEAVKYLLSRGANATVRNSYEMNIFQLAIPSGNLELVEYLLEHLLSGGVSKRLLEQNFPVCSVAVLCRHHHILEFLIEKYFDINDQHPLTGITPFMFAHALEYDEAISTLLKHKVETTTKNYLGLTAVDIATVRQHLKMFHQRHQRNVPSNIPSSQPEHIQNELMNQQLRNLLQVKPEGNNTTQNPLTTPLCINASQVPLLLISPFPQTPNLINGQRRSSNISPSLVLATPNISPIMLPQMAQQMFFPPSFSPNNIMFNVSSDNFSHHSYTDMLNSKFLNHSSVDTHLSPFNVPSPCM